MLKLFYLGTPQIQLSTESLADRLTPKAQALFVYLAVTGQSHSRDRLADLLWSEMNNQQARNNLRYLLPDLRNLLDDYLIITSKSISFDRQASYWLDVDLLRTTLAARPNLVETPALQSALDLYQGEFLTGFTVRNAPVFEGWVVQQREELHRLVVQGCYTLAARYWQQAAYQAGLAATRRLLQWEPWHEAGHRLQMQLLAATGQRTAALAQYDLCRTVLADELGVAPEAATVALWEQIRSGFYDEGTSDKVISPNLVTLSPLHPDFDERGRVVTLFPPHNLPNTLTPFFGREAEIEQIGALLADPSYRLITLVGEGGSGKTRLALVVGQKIVDFRLTNDDSVVETTDNRQSVIVNGAEHLLRDGAAAVLRHRPSAIGHHPFPDGVWFVALNALTTGNLADQLAAAVAQAIGFSFSGQQPLFTQLLTYLRKKALLLLFDNAEHLLPEVADLLVQILQACPALTALVTSRHLLGLQAEFVWRVIGLAVPPQDDLPPGDLLAYSSLALFVERARRCNQKFDLTMANRAVMVAICRLVEGLPLAVELAAALTKAYTCAELYTALQQDYTVLATNLRDLLPRHRSIQAMLDHSWRFLTPAEAEALAACSHFAGGFTPAAALAVMGATPTLLSNLVDQSLLQVHEGRFTMHELVRQYAAAKSAQHPEQQHATAARHAAYTMQQLAELAATLLVTADAREIFQRDLGNVRLAWRWCAQQGDLALLAQGMAGLESGYRLTGLYDEAVHLLGIALTAVRQVLAAAPTHPQGNAILARLLCHTAQFYRRTGQVARGERSATEALTLAQQLDDPALQGWAYHELTRLAQMRNDFATMAVLAEQSVAQARRAAVPFLLAECLNDLGVARAFCTSPLVVIPHFQEARQHLQGGVNHLLEGTLVSNLGFSSLGGHEYQAAYDFLHQGLTLRRLLRDEEGTAIAHLHLGDLWLALGHYEKAHQAYEQAASIMQALHIPYWESWLQANIGRLHHLRGDLTAAHAACEVGRRLATANGFQMQEQWVRINHGRLLADQGDYAAAYQCYQPIFATPPPTHWIYRTVDAYAARADLLRQTNDLAGAVTHIETALTLLEQLGLAAAYEPFTVYWTAVRIFTAATDPRATTVLQTANQQLQKIAATLQDPVLRRSFLETVVVNRAIAQAGVMV